MSSCAVSRAAACTAAARASAPASSSRRAPRRVPPTSAVGRASPVRGRGAFSGARLPRGGAADASTAALPRFLDGFASAFGGGAAAAAQKRADAKAALLEAIEGCARGVTASEALRVEIETRAARLERLNPTKEGALRSGLINGEWELLYTTSAAILGANRPWPFRPLGPIYQTIDARRLRARNRETFPFFNAVDARLTPTSASAADVRFTQFSIFGAIKVKAPESATGALDTTYLDAELRISRGDKGNLFVLAMRDPAKELRGDGDD
jgi:hypothetical protein